MIPCGTEVYLSSNLPHSLPVRITNHADEHAYKLDANTHTQISGSACIKANVSNTFYIEDSFSEMVDE